MDSLDMLSIMLLTRKTSLFHSLLSKLKAENCIGMNIQLPRTFKALLNQAIPFFRDLDLRLILFFRALEDRERISNLLAF